MCITVHNTGRFEARPFKCRESMGKATSRLSLSSRRPIILDIRSTLFLNTLIYTYHSMQVYCIVKAGLEGHGVVCSARRVCPLLKTGVCCMCFVLKGGCASSERERHEMNFDTELAPRPALNQSKKKPQGPFFS